MNHTHAGQRMRSAIAPVISAGVMTANVNWNATNASVGIEAPVTTVGEILQADVVEVADQAAVADVAEREAVTDKHPQHRDDAHREEVLHQHREHVLGADHAAVEQRKAGCHEEDERGRGEHPRGIAGIEFRARCNS